MFWHHFFDLCEITAIGRPYISSYLNDTSVMFLRAYVRFRVYGRAY